MNPTNTATATIPIKEKGKQIKATSFSMIQSQSQQQQDIMQHYFGPFNLSKNMNKHQQNLSQGSSQIKINNNHNHSSSTSYRNNSTNNSKTEINSSQQSQQQQQIIQLHKDSSNSTINQHHHQINKSNSNNTNHNQQKIQSHKTTATAATILQSQQSRSSLSPIEKSSRNVMKIAPGMSKQKSLPYKTNIHTTSAQIKSNTLKKLPPTINHESHSSSLSIQQQLSLIQQQQKVVQQQQQQNQQSIDKENVCSNIQHSISEGQFQQFNSNINNNNNYKQNTLTQKVLQNNTASKTITTSRNNNNNVNNHPSSARQTISSTKNTSLQMSKQQQMQQQLIQQQLKQQQSLDRLTKDRIMIGSIDELNDVKSIDNNNRRNGGSKLETNQLSTEACSIPQSSIDKYSNLLIRIHTDEDSLSGQQQQYHFLCDNHPHKKGKYLATSQSNPNINEEARKIVICSRCAIELATQGYIITEIKQENGQEQMIQEIQQILKNIDDIQPQLENNLKNISLRRQILLQEYNKQIYNVENDFVILERELNETKNNIINILNHHKIEQNNIYSELSCQTKDYINQLSQIQTDIMLHYDQIIQDIEFEPFTSVMLNYQNKISIVQEFFQNIQSSKIQCVNVKQNINVWNSNFIMKLFDVQKYYTNIFDFNNDSVVLECLNNNNINGFNVCSQIQELNNINQDINNNQFNNNNNLQNENNNIKQQFDYQQPIKEEVEYVEDKKSQKEQEQIKNIVFDEQMNKQAIKQNELKQDLQININQNKNNSNNINSINNINNNKNNLGLQKRNEQYDEVNFKTNINTIGQSSEEYLFNNILPISQTSSIMVKSISNYVSNFNTNNLNKNESNQHSSNNNNIQYPDHIDEFDEDQFKSPDIICKKMHQNKQLTQNINDTPLIQAIYSNNNNNNCKIKQQTTQIQNNNNNNNNQQFDNFSSQNQQNNHQFSQFQQYQRNNHFNNQININNTNQSTNSIEYNKNFISQLQNNNNNFNLSQSNSNLQFNNIQQNQQDYEKKVQQQFPIIDQQKQPSNAFRKLFSQQQQQQIQSQEQQIINEENIQIGSSQSQSQSAKSSGEGNSSVKYKNILDKIHASQVRNNSFYQDIIRNNSISPKIRNESSPFQSDISPKQIVNKNNINNNNNSINVSQFIMKSNENNNINNQLNHLTPSKFNDDHNLIQQQQSTFGQPFYESLPNYNSNINPNNNNNCNFNNITNNNSLSEQNSSKQLDNIEYNSTSKFGNNTTINNNNNNNNNNFTQLLQEYSCQQQNQQLQLQQQQQDKPKTQTDSFAQCIEKQQILTNNNNNNIINNTLQNQNDILGEDIQQSSQYDQLEVVKKSYNQFQNSLIVRDSFANNTSYMNGQLFDNTILSSQNYPFRDYKNDHHLEIQQQQQQQEIQQLQQQQQFELQQKYLKNIEDMKQNQENKGCRDFLSFIEMKIQDEENNNNQITTERMNKNKSDFRKTLFFSPKFNSNQNTNEIENKQSINNNNNNQ